MSKQKEKRYKRWAGAAAVLLLSVVLLGGCTGLETQQNKQEKLSQITVGVSNYEPFAYMNDAGALVGVNVELATEAFHRIGYEPVFEKIVWEEKDVHMEDGTVDCLWCCLTMPDEADDLYQWAGPTLYSRQVFVVRTDSSIKELTDLNGQCIAVQAKAESEALLLQHAKKQLPKPRLLYTFPSMNEVYASLRKGYVDAICGYENAVQKFIDTAPNEYRKLDESVCVSKLGVAFPKSFDAAVVAQLTDVLREMQADGTTAAIVKKYGLDENIALRGEVAE